MTKKPVFVEPAKTGIRMTRLERERTGGIKVSNELIGKSKCKKCSKLIEEGSLRIARPTEIYGNTAFKYLHLKCYKPRTGSHTLSELTKKHKLTPGQASQVEERIMLWNSMQEKRQMKFLAEAVKKDEQQAKKEERLEELKIRKEQRKLSLYDQDPERCKLREIFSVPEVLYIWEYISSYYTIEMLLCTALVSRYMYKNIAENDLVWQSLCERQWGKNNKNVEYCLVPQNLSLFYPSHDVAKFDWKTKYMYLRRMLCYGCGKINSNVQSHFHPMLKSLLCTTCTSSWYYGISLVKDAKKVFQFDEEEMGRLHTLWVSRYGKKMQVCMNGHALELSRIVASKKMVVDYDPAHGLLWRQGQTIIRQHHNMPKMSIRDCIMVK